MGKTKHTGPIKLPAKPDPKLWVSKIPFGLGKVKPKHIRETAKIAWQNRDNLPYAVRILTQGVCDGCALGVSGLYDQTLAGPHICTTRLNVLRLNTMPAIREELLHADIDELSRLSSTELRQLGRIPYPLIRRKGERRFRRATWDEALDLVATKMRGLNPKQMAFYLTARGITNESYYVAAKVARLLGTNNIDNASRICHSPSKTALKRSIGVGASTCNYKDWIGTDVLVFWGSVAANNQPVSTKYMYAAKRKGTKIIVINPYYEPSMEQYWIPSIAESALFGTKLADDVYQVNIGGDIAFMNGIMKVWFEMEAREPGSAVDHAFVAAHTNGYDELRAHVAQQDWTTLEQSSGLTRERMSELAHILARAASAVFVWSMGLTQHRFGTDNISQVANLALLRGFLGREHCGLMPIRGHSGVQGSGEMGADPFSLPGGEMGSTADRNRIEQLWGFELPSWQGDIVGVTLENALLPEEQERKLRLFYTSGGNFLETMPDPAFVRQRTYQLGCPCPPGHHPQHLHAARRAGGRGRTARDDTLRAARGGTSTSTERMVYFSPEIAGPRIGEARAEWDIYVDLARRVKPEAAAGLGCGSAEAIRAEIALAAPSYDGIQHLRERGDVFQSGGAWLCEDGVCPTPDGRGRLLPIELPELRKPEGHFAVTTRRGKQFNSMIYSDIDPFNEAERYDVLIHKEDAKALSLSEGEAIVVYNAYGNMHGRAKQADVKQGNIEVHWPEGNSLIPKGVYEPFAGIPEYNTAVIVEKAETYHAHKDTRYVEKRILELETEMEG